MTAAEICRSLGGHPSSGGGFLCRCPVPSHGNGKGDRRPSLFIRDGDRAPLVFCFAGCEPHDILAELRKRDLAPAAKAAHVQYPRRAEPREPEPDPEALSMWRSAVPITGTVGEAYLRRRGITIPIPPSIRFTHLRYPRTGVPMPAIVAAVQRPDRQVIAVQTTFLTLDGRKAPVTAPRLTTGCLGSGAIRLGPIDAVLGLAEGTESALSAMQLSGVPCWATLGAQRLAKLTLPARDVHVFADSDEPGRSGAEKAAERYTREGRRVVLRYTPTGAGDWNDALQARCPVAA